MEHGRAGGREGEKMRKREREEREQRERREKREERRCRERDERGRALASEFPITAQAKSSDGSSPAELIGVHAETGCGAG